MSATSWLNPQIDMDNQSKLPLKVVPKLERDFYKPDPSGGKKKIFGGEVTKDMRLNLARDVIRVRDYFTSSFRANPRIPAVASVRIRSDAVAKSHRPSNLLASTTCPIIGVQGLDELLISVTETGLERLAKKIESVDSHSMVANISTLSSFRAYEPLLDFVAGEPAKVKLFQHNLPDSDRELEEVFLRTVKEFTGKVPVPIKYGRGLLIYRVETKSPEELEPLANFVGLQSLGPFPKYEPVRTESIAIRRAVANDFPVPKEGVDYPVVGLIDGGTSITDPLLGPWRVGREALVPSGFQNVAHGSFVAGLLVHAKSLNHGDNSFPSCSSKFLDVVALEIGGTSEDVLLSRVEEAIEKYPEIRVWNLSIGSSTTVTNRAFSDFAVALDRIQDEYNVKLIVAAGNYRVSPFRGWPPEDLGEADRICAPSDSVRSIIVGSTAHRDHNSARVKSHQPSPFSRRGPGPLYLPKPELSHFGGNCDAKGGYSQIGVMSIDSKGNLAEDVGTSFATPLITTLYANIDHALNDGLSPLASHALLVHSAALQSRKVDSKDLRYFGFGVPPDVDAILGCEPWQSTLIFELNIPVGVAYEKAMFPMPPSLQVNGVLKANILMTLVHECALDANYGSEYCRSNIEVSMGTYNLGEDGKRHQRKQVPEDPRLVGSAYEKDLVEHGFKWSPVKVYRREMKRGVTGDVWRLDLSAQRRSGHQQSTDERAALIITIADPLKRAPVYNEMVIQMNNHGWAASDLQVRPRLRN